MACTFHVDLDIEALTKSVLDVSRDLDQYLGGLLKPEPLRAEALKNVSMSLTFLCSLQSCGAAAFPRPFCSCDCPVRFL